MAARVQGSCCYTKILVEQHFDPRAAWPQYAANVVQYVVVPAGHYPQEQAPDEVYAALTQFFSA